MAMRETGTFYRNGKLWHSYADVHPVKRAARVAAARSADAVRGALGPRTAPVDPTGARVARMFGVR